MQMRPVDEFAAQFKRVEQSKAERFMTSVGMALELDMGFNCN
jgi:hypothetical protein